MPDDAEWLSEAEMAAWLPLLSVSMWLPAALDMQLQRDAGMSNFEYGVLAALSNQDDHAMRLRDLARSANSSLPRLSKVLDRFEGHGWVTRHPDLSDGRSTLAHLTEAGFVTLMATAPGHVARVRELVFDHLTATQVRQLGIIATAIAGSVGPNGAAAPRLR